MKRFSLAALCVLVLTGTAAADGPTTPPPPVQASTPRSMPSEVFPGTQSFTGPRRRVQAAKGPSDVTLNFPNADVHEVAKAILGDILGLNYAVDPSATGTVTVETAEPVAKADVLPILEESLSAAHLGLIKKGTVYTIIPIDKAKKQPQLLTAADPGFGSESITLHFVNAVELKKLLDPLVPDNALTQADAGRNIVVITGTADQRNAMRGLVQQFDVNWLHGMSFALLLPEKTDAHMLQPELDAIVNTQNSPTAGLVKLIVIDRINGILAISPQPQYLKDLKKWMEILDRAGGDNERKLFVYRVQNGRAADVATVLINAFGGGAGAGASQARPTAPNLTATGQPSQIQGMNSGFGGTGGTTGGFGGLGGGLGGTGGFQPGGGYQPGGTQQANNSDNDNSPLSPGSTMQQPQNVSQTINLPGGGQPISVSSDESNNAIVVFATPRQYGIILDALKQLDIAPLQVVIEAAISEVSLTKELNFGVQWLLQHGSNSIGFTESTTGTAPVTIVPGLAGTVMRGDITATLNALQNITTVKVISSPKLMVLNNHSASLQVGDQVPISTGNLSTSGVTDPTVVNEIQYLPTGVILQVTPRVNDNGLVLLDISQEVSDVKPGTASGGSSTTPTPTIQDRKFNTSIAVHDGQTIALGGLIRDDTSHTGDGIPFLSEIPYLGALFGSTDNKKDRTELLVLLTPRVIRNAQEQETVTEELTRKIQTIRPRDPVTGIVKD
ncbi:MAG TPA: type II secretion system secretin GspD [Rhizomicrobium sp.]|nr:type II secretion system secretin GspD [Rhizomicrobium sp.]